jgi:hypothetical protein
MNGSGLTKLTPEQIIKVPKKTLAELATPAPSGERHFQMGRLIIPMFRPQESYWQAGRRHAKWRTAWASRSPRCIDGYRPLRRRKDSRLEVEHSGERLWRRNRGAAGSPPVEALD